MVMVEHCIFRGKMDVSVIHGLKSYHDDSSKSHWIRMLYNYYLYSFTSFHAAHLRVCTKTKIPHAISSDGVFLFFF